MHNFKEVDKCVNVYESYIPCCCKIGYIHVIFTSLTLRCHHTVEIDVTSVPSLRCDGVLCYHGIV